MCLKGFKLKPKTPQISEKCLEAKLRGCFSHVQQVNLKNNIMYTSPGYLSIDTKLFRKFHSILPRKRFAVKLKKKKLIGHSPPLVKVAICNQFAPVIGKKLVQMETKLDVTKMS